MKLLGTYPKETVDDLEDLEEWFKSNGKKNPAKTIEKIKEFNETGFIPSVQEAMDDPVVSAVINR